MRQPVQVAVYCVRKRNDKWEYLLLHRIPSGGDFWQAVTGGVEAKEDYHVAALRELQEETGYIPISFVQIDYTYSFPIEEHMRKLYEQHIEELREIVFLAVIEEQTDPKLDPIEHDRWIWCSYDKALQMLYWSGNRESLKHCEMYIQSHQDDLGNHSNIN